MKVFRSLGIDSNNDVLLGHVLGSILIDDLNKFVTFGGGILLMIYTVLGIIEKFKKMKKDKKDENESD